MRSQRPAGQFINGSVARGNGFYPTVAEARDLSEFCQLNVTNQLDVGVIQSPVVRFNRPAGRNEVEQEGADSGGSTEAKWLSLHARGLSAVYSVGESPVKAHALQMANGAWV